MRECLVHVGVHAKLEGVTSPMPLEGALGGSPTHNALWRKHLCDLARKRCRCDKNL
jgi:hypothetical protein